VDHGLVVADVELFRHAVLVSLLSEREVRNCVWVAAEVAAVRQQRRLDLFHVVGDDSHIHRLHRYSE